MFDMKLTNKSLKIYLDYLKPMLVGTHLTLVDFFTKEDLVFYFAKSDPSSLVLSLNGSQARLILTNRFPRFRGVDNSFLDKLKKELGNGYLLNLEQVNEDRIVHFTFEVTNRIFQREKVHLYFEMLPHRGNLILTNDESKIIGLLKPSLLTDDRVLLLNMPYTFPNKPDAPIDNVSFDPEEYLLSEQSYITSLTQKRKDSEMRPILKALNNRLNLLKRKKVKLQEEKQAAETYPEDQMKGEYLFTYCNPSDFNLDKVEIEGITIALDPLKTIKANAEAYFKRAKKKKATLKFSEENIEKVNKEYTSLEAIKNNIEALSYDELKSLGLKVKLNGKNSLKEINDFGTALNPYYIGYRGKTFYFGKNARQNDSVTFLLKRLSRDAYWFHLKDGPSSHVLLEKDGPLSEEDKLAAGSIALLNSEMPSGEIILSQKKHLKRGNKPGEVKMTHYESFYVREIDKNIKPLLLKAEKVNHL